MEDRMYNGWANYPTWCVNLWLCNDEGLYNEALMREGFAMDDHPQQRLHVADALREWVTDDLAPDLGASFPADLLGWALGQVDWLEIADTWIETCAEQVA